MSKVAPEQIHAAPTSKHMQREPPKAVCATDDEARAWAEDWWKRHEAKQKDDKEKKQ